MSASTNLTSFEQAVNAAYDILEAFTTDEMFEAQATTAFGSDFDHQKLENLRQQWQVRDFSGLPIIQILPAATLNGAKGAYSSSTNTIYLSQDLIDRNADNIPEITNVLLEEIGHFVDAHINSVDAPGDEGSIFAALVQNKPLDEATLQVLKIEDDTAAITVNGQIIQVEQASGGNDVTLAGRIFWTDLTGKEHPVRLATVKIWDQEEIGADELVGIAITNANGEYSISFDNNDSVLPQLLDRRDIYIEVSAEGKSYSIPQQGQLGNSYKERSKVEKDITNGTHSDFNLKSSSAFAVSDALNIGEAYAEAIAGKTPATKLTVNFPNDKVLTSQYLRIDKSLDIRSQDFQYQDVIIHEYGHYLSDVNSLEQSPGGVHVAGIDNIRLYGKLNGTQLAWSEGLANYIAKAAQKVAFPFTNDTKRISAFNFYDVEQNTPIFALDNSPILNIQAGEGEEVTITRILWDIADEANEPFDQIALGHVELYRILRDKIPKYDPATSKGLDQIDDVWDYFFNSSNDATRVKYGAIFEGNRVSPKPIGTVIDKKFDIKDKTRPLFEWDATTNNGANDTFEVVIFNNDYSQRVLTSGQLKGKVFWQPSLEDWKKVVNTPGNYHFIVSGSDTDTFETGPYWSGVRDFSVIDPSTAQLDLSPILDSLNQVLAGLQNSVNDQVYGTKGLQNMGGLSSLPLLGNLLGTEGQPSGSSALQALASQSNYAPGTQFIQTLSDQIRNKFAEKFPAGKASAEEIRAALTELFKQPIDFTVDGSKVKFAIDLQGKNTFNALLPSQIGIPNLGIDVGANAKAAVDLGYTFKFGFGVDTFTNEVFLDTTPNQDLTLSLKPSLELGASVGFLKAQAKDTGSNLAFSIDLTDGNDNNLTINELNNLQVSPTGSADIKLNFATGLDTSVVALPKIQTDFNLHWDFVSGGSAPTVGFSNTSIDLGSLSSFIKTTALSEIQNQFSNITSPIKGITEKLSADLPVVGFSLKDAAKTLADSPGSPLGSGRFASSTLDFISQVNEGVKLLDSIDALLKIPNADGTLKLDAFNLGDGFDIRTTNVRESQNVPKPGSPLDPSGTYFRSPIWEEPKSAIGLLLGQNVDFLTYQTPKLDFGFDYHSPPIPVFGPVVLMIGGAAGAAAQLKLGYDSQGLESFKSSNFSDAKTLLNGLFVSNPDTKLFVDDNINRSLGLTGELTAEAGVTVGVLSLAVGGGIGLTVGLGVTDPTGKARPATTPPLCLFDPSGALSALMFASFRLNFGFFKITKRLNLPGTPINIIDFSPSIGGCDVPLQNHFDVKNPEPDPKTAAKLAEQGIIDRNGTDGDDRIFITHIADVQADPQRDPKLYKLDPQLVDGKVELTGLPEPIAYDNVQLVVINGGQGSDLIDMVRMIASGQLDGGSGDDVLIGGLGDDFLTGGQGNDFLNGGDGGINTAVYASSPERVYANLETGEANDGFGTTDKLLNIQGVEGSDKDDILIANRAGSIFNGGLGNDKLIGGDGDDVLLGGAGADTLEGNGGFNTATYLDSPAPIYVNVSNRDVILTFPLDKVSITLAANTGYGGDAEGDRISNISNLQGSVYDDILVGTDTQGNTAKPDQRFLFTNTNYLDGLLGNDFIIAGAARELIDGGTGLLGAQQTTKLTAPMGDEADWISYRTSTGGVNVSLTTARGYGGYAEGDILKFVTDANGNEVVFDQDANGNSLFRSTFENLEGSDQNDTLLEGDVGKNVIVGRAGDDVLKGEANDDTLIGGAGADTLDGGINSPTLRSLTNDLTGGGDTASYAEATSGVTVNLGTGVGNRGEAEGDRLFNIENLIGSDGGDVLIGDAGDNDIDPSLSNGEIDVVDGGNGLDRLTVNYSLSDYGTAGVFGGFPYGYLLRNDPDATLRSQVNFSNIERLYVIGTSQNDALYGGNINEGDVFLTGAGNDFIDGGLGSDLIDADDGNDIVIDQLVNGQFVSNLVNHVIQLNGGSGIDTLSVDLSTKTDAITLTGADPISVNENLTQPLSFSDGSSITGFEILKWIKTGSVADSLTQQGRVDNWFITGAGDDSVNSGLGKDTVDGGEGIDTLTIDYSQGDTGSGMIMQLNSNRLSGELWRLKSGTNSGDPDPRNILDNINFSNFERYNVTGTSKTDKIATGDGEDTLIGGAGNDTLSGNLGNDNLDGGDGNDILIGTSQTPFKDTGRPFTFVFNDRNGNGNVEVNEPGIPGVVVTLQKDGQTIQTVTSSDNGALLFGPLPDGTYSMTVTPPAGFWITTRNPFPFTIGSQSLLFDLGIGIRQIAGDVDTLTGGNGADTFVLGDENSTFYVNAGYGDYALITDFNPSQGDKIQLHRSIDDIENSRAYYLDTAPVGFSDAVAIYAGNPYISSGAGTLPADLIAIVRGQGLEQLGSYGQLDPSTNSLYTLVGPPTPTPIIPR